MAVKKRRSSSSPEDSCREKIPHLDEHSRRSRDPFLEPSTSSYSPEATKAVVVDQQQRKDVNLTAELFWLKTHLSEHWSMKWLWQVEYSSSVLHSFIHSSIHPCVVSLD